MTMIRFTFRSRKPIFSFFALRFGTSSKFIFSSSDDSESTLESSVFAFASADTAGNFHSQILSKIIKESKQFNQNSCKVHIEGQRQMIYLCQLYAVTEIKPSAAILRVTSLLQLYFWSFFCRSSLKFVENFRLFDSL